MKQTISHQIPAIQWGTVFEGKQPITFFGNSGRFYILNGVYYIIWDGCHVATKVNSRITYKQDTKLPTGFKKACRNL
jgi:hypothetical protein